MTDWLSRMASKRKRKKDDNFWTEFLQRSQSDNYLKLNESERQAYSWQPRNSVDEFSSLLSDKSKCNNLLVLKKSNKLKISMNTIKSRIADLSPNIEYLINNQIDIDPEFVEIVNENFNDLIKP